MGVFHLNRQSRELSLPDIVAGLQLVDHLPHMEGRLIIDDLDDGPDLEVLPSSQSYFVSRQKIIGDINTVRNRMPGSVCSIEVGESQIVQFAIGVYGNSWRKPPTSFTFEEPVVKQETKGLTFDEYLNRYQAAQLQIAAKGVKRFLVGNYSPEQTAELNTRSNEALRAAQAESDASRDRFFATSWDDNDNPYRAG